MSDGHHIVIEVICAKCMEDPGGQIMSNSKRRSDSEGVDESFSDGHHQFSLKGSVGVNYAFFHWELCRGGGKLCPIFH